METPRHTENSPKHATAWLGKSSLKHIVRHWPRWPTNGEGWPRRPKSGSS